MLADATRKLSASLKRIELSKVIHNANCDNIKIKSITFQVRKSNARTPERPNARTPERRTPNAERRTPERRTPNADAERYLH
jgi:hypothetical protein